MQKEACMWCCYTQLGVSLEIALPACSNQSKDVAKECMDSSGWIYGFKDHWHGSFKVVKPW